MEPSRLFGATSWLSLTLASGQKEAVRKASPGFPVWAGEPPGSNYGGKPVVDFQGRPAFAELRILYTVDDAGWSGVWVTHAGGREKHRRGFWGTQEDFTVPAEVLHFLGEIRRERGDTSKGTWDIVCWPKATDHPQNTDLRFIESKWGGKDTIKTDQIEWYRRVRNAGVSRDAFLVIEWNLSRALGA